MRRKLKHSLNLIGGLAAASILAAAAPADAGGQAKDIYFVTWDDFRDGFSEVGSDGWGAKWFYFAAGPYVGNDGLIETGPKGLRVVAPGVNPDTGEPAFTLTLAQEEQNGGLPGGLDHVKWLAYMNHLASSGYPGFDAVPGREVSCQALISGRLYGTAGHPFGAAVDNANDDLRLAAFALNTIDFDSFVVYDFFFTNETIYAVYERLPFARGPVYGNYAAFTHTIPLAPYNPDELHHVKIGYDKAAGVVRWYLNDVEVFRVDQIGMRLPTRDYLTIDHGGTETIVSPNQIACGMGTFTLLDAHLPSRTALVKLSTIPGFYFHPEVGEPEPQTFLDEQSLESNRLFGQGAELNVLRYWVSSLPAE
jgi:hypothetical protein